MGAITLNNEHGYVLLTSAALAVQCLLTGFLIAGFTRVRIFKKEFLEKNFGEEHKKVFGEEVPKHGNPDMGTGRYSDKLSYKDWFNFNTAQRVHYNYVEQLAVVVILIFVSGVGLPIPATILGWIYFLGRVIYTYGYAYRGPNKRLKGVILIDLSLFGLIITSVISSVKVITA